ncbi:MSL complex subunit 3 [Euwallacea similis]|uniref:MSL complex subunit 3 n=1 Tax=Euwallacea similis TaxID=1736056 RepID=UPI00344CE3D6
MVSTRGIKLKFLVGERVLCYEPDPTKAKVLYDSKVLDIVLQKDQTGKKIVEYLIHFQGWNSSWDRRVGEEFVLKDTVENRQLQKDLAEKAQLQLGAYLYRKERKKHTPSKPSDSTAASSEDGSSGSPGRIDTDENPEMSSSSDESSSIEDDAIEIEIVPELREILEADYYLINGKNRRIKLPAEPNVVTILESYCRHYATNQFCGVNEKPHPRYKIQFGTKDARPKTEDINKNIALCQEVVESLRIYFDFSVNDILLYAAEKDQFVTAPVAMQPIDVQNEIKTELKYENNSSKQNISLSYHNNHSNHNGFSDLTNNSRRRTLRSNNKSNSQLNGNLLSEERNGSGHLKPGLSVGSSNSGVNGHVTKSLSWRLLPDAVYNQQPPPPCLVYGAIHFARLFVKLPELLTQSSIPGAKMKLTLNHVDSIIDFLNEHREWYGEKFYVDAH